MEDRTVVQPVAAGSVRPGTRLNGLYEIEKLIAQGGMGEVYRGFNIQTMDPVAIKMIRPEFLNDKEIIELFRREASILHNLNHEAIVRYFVFSVDPVLYRAYLSMEFVEGPSLTDRLATGPMQRSDVQILRRRIALALEVAHQHKVVHRDISPDNIILPQDDVRSAKVIDFGIARSLHRAEVSIIGGRFAGKCNYASPEQFGLAGGEVGFKSDIYSFGLVLAAAVRGSPIDMSGSEVEAIAKRTVVPDLSNIDATIWPLLHAMLQPSPANRPASMAEVAAWEPAASRALWTLSPRARAPRPLTAPRTREARGGKAALGLGAVIALTSLAGATFVFRGDLSRWTQSAIVPGPPSSSETSQTASTPTQPVLPQLTPPEPGANNQTTEQRESESSPPHPSAQKAPTSSTEATNRESDQLTESNRVPPNPAPHGPTADELADAAPPRAREPNPDLPGATVGAPYRAELPAFADPGGKGLLLAADGLPDGMNFKDLGDGRGAIEGSAKQPGSASIQVVATNHHGQAARMTVKVVIADRPQPPPAKPVNPATPPTASSGSQNDATEATQHPQSTDGTVGPPAKPTQKEAKLSPPPQTPAERARRFVATFNGGDCFYIRHLGESGGKESYLGFGRDLTPFQRFDTDYKTEVGAEADIRLGLIKPQQCSALDLIRLGGGEPVEAPHLALLNGDVGRGKPLTGKIANLAGRRLYLILVDNEGLAYRLDVSNHPGDDTATFNIPLTPDARSAGSNQVLLAIVSDASIAVLENLHQAPLQSIANRLFDEARSASATVEGTISSLSIDLL